MEDLRSSSTTAASSLSPSRALLEVEEPPFDQGNAPDSFSGFGTVDGNGDTLTSNDRDGARLTFVVDDGTPSLYDCA